MNTPDFEMAKMIFEVNPKSALVRRLSDIAVMILHWEQPVQPGTNGDLSADGIVGPDDIGVVITNWGSNCNQDLRIGDEGFITGQGTGGSRRAARPTGKTHSENAQPVANTPTRTALSYRRLQS
jgi:hypothetical protein